MESYSVFFCKWTYWRNLQSCSRLFKWPSYQRSNNALSLPSVFNDTRNENKKIKTYAYNKILIHVSFNHDILWRLNSTISHLKKKSSRITGISAGNLQASTESARRQTSWWLLFILKKKEKTWSCGNQMKERTQHKYLNGVTGRVVCLLLCLCLLFRLVPTVSSFLRSASFHLSNRIAFDSMQWLKIWLKIRKMSQFRDNLTSSQNISCIFCIICSQ